MNEWMADRVMVAVAALILNGLLGGPRALHRKLGLHKLGQWLAGVMRGFSLHHPEDQKRGTVTTVILLLLAVAIGAGLMWLCRQNYWGGLLEIALLTMLLSLRQAADFGQAIAQRLGANQAEDARAELAGTAWRNAPLLDGHGVCRAAIETASVQLADRVISVLFWYVLLGLPGALAARLLATLSEATLHARDGFGHAADRAAGLVHYLPSLLAGLLLTAASPFLPACSWQRAGKAWLISLMDVCYRRRILNVMGASLNIALGGPASVYAQGPWLGGVEPKAYPRDVRGAVLLLWLSGLLLLITLALLPA
jgi:adenosylcobinamide-phosphate synthase